MSNNIKESKRRYHPDSDNEKQSIIKDSTIKNILSNISSKQKKKWTAEEDENLIYLINLQENINFLEISKRIPGRSAVQCCLRWQKIKKGLKKGQWSLYEDKLLREWVDQNGPRKWEQCGKYIHGRSGKQCREHWNNCLNPDLIKGEWTAEEDFLIMYFYEKCNGSWKKIVYLFNGRTENSIKNRFFSQLRKIATKDMTVLERKFCSKIGLEELKKFLNEAISESKKEFLKKNPMNEEELKAFLKKMELQLEKKIIEEYENCENKKLIQTLEDIKNSETNFINKDNKEKSFIGKRKRRTEEICEISTQNEEEKNIKIQNNQDKINDNNINKDENKENNTKNKLFNNNIAKNEIKESRNESNNNNFTYDNKNINNGDIFYNYEDEDKIQYPINGIESKPLNIFNDIFDKIDYHYQPSYKFLEKNSFYRTDSLGNIIIVENNPFNYSEQKDNIFNYGIRFCNEDNNELFENR